MNNPDQPLYKKDEEIPKIKSNKGDDRIVGMLIKQILIIFFSQNIIFKKSDTFFSFKNVKNSKFIFFWLLNF